MKRALIIATLALSIAAPAVASDLSDATDFTTHVDVSTGAFPSTLDRFEAWADTEEAWLLANPPGACYGAIWGQWIVIVAETRITGLLVDAFETGAAAVVSDDVMARATTLAAAMRAFDPTTCLS